MIDVIDMFATMERDAGITTLLRQQTTPTLCSHRGQATKEAAIHCLAMELHLGSRTCPDHETVALSPRIGVPFRLTIRPRRAWPMEVDDYGRVVLPGHPFGADRADQRRNHRRR